MLYNNLQPSIKILQHKCERFGCHWSKDWIEIILNRSCSLVVWIGVWWQSAASFLSLLIIHFYSHCKLFIQISCRPFLIKDNFFSITQSTLAVFVCICSYGSLCCQTRWLPASFSDLWTLTRLRRSSLDVKRVKFRFSLKVLNEIIT